MKYPVLASPLDPYRFAPAPDVFAVRRRHASVRCTDNYVGDVSVTEGIVLSTKRFDGCRTVKMTLVCPQSSL